MKLKDKVCIVTGGCRGLGFATAIKFAQEGARVAICDVNVEGLNKAVEEIKKINSEVMGFKVDVTNKEDIEQMIKGIMDRYGKIDVLVNNAGILIDAQIYKMTDEQFDKVINVNLKGTFLCTRAVAGIMRAQESGAIINLSSLAGVYGNFGQTSYSATKAGVIGFTKTWAKELGRKGIRTNAIAPGLIESDMISTTPEKQLNSMKQIIPLQRFGKPEEIANVAAFLASDESSYVNGVTIEVGGGVVVP